MAATTPQLDPIIDYEQLVKDYLLTVNLYSLENSFGWLLQLISISIFIAINTLEFLHGRMLITEIIFGNSFDINIISSVISLSIFCYGAYLARDKNKYNSHITHTSFNSQRLKNAGQLNSVNPHFNDYLALDSLLLLGEVVQTPAISYQNFILKLFADNKSRDIFIRLGLNIDQQQLLLKKFIETNQNWDLAKLESILKISFNLSFQYKFEYLDNRALIFTVLLNDLDGLLLGFGIKKSTMLAVIDWIKLTLWKEELLNNIKANGLFKPRNQVNLSLTSVYSPTIEEYCLDLTAKANQSIGNPDLSISYRQQELQQVLNILNTDEGLCLLIGPTGVGKTTLIDTLAFILLSEDLPSNLKDKRLLSLNLTKLLGAAAKQNEIPLLLNKIFTEEERSGNMILVIENLDQILNLHSDLQKEILALLSAEITKVRVKLIATITPSNYEKYLKELPELSSLFEIVSLTEATPEMTIQILLDESTMLQRKYNIKIDYQIIQRVTELAPQYDFLKVLPDKALALLRDVIIAAKDNGLKYADLTSVESFFKHKVGIEDSLLINNITDVEAELHKYIIGQDEAVATVAMALKRAKAGLNNINKPISSFMFYGPTGVGKTELAKSIAQVYFGQAKLFLRLDMSEYQENTNVANLLGSFEDNQFNQGILTQFVLDHPFCLILLDELEKANPKVSDLFLQILDNGHITDGAGRSVNFSNTILVATSNAGSNVITNYLKANRTLPEIKEAASTELRKYFKLEFLNRFDAVIMFKLLTKIEAAEIIQLLLAAEKKKLADKGIEFVYGDKLITRVLEVGFNPDYGARELKRAVTEIIENQVATNLLAGKLKSGDTFTLE